MENQIKDTGGKITPVFFILYRKQYEKSLIFPIQENAFHRKSLILNKGGCISNLRLI